MATGNTQPHLPSCGRWERRPLRRACAEAPPSSWFWQARKPRFGQGQNPPNSSSPAGDGRCGCPTGGPGRRMKVQEEGHTFPDVRTGERRLGKRGFSRFISCAIEARPGEVRGAALSAPVKAAEPTDDRPPRRRRGVHWRAGCLLSLKVGRLLCLAREEAARAFVPPARAPSNPRRRPP